MTLTFQLDLSSVLLNQLAKYLRQGLFRTKCIVQNLLSSYTNAHVAGPS